MPKLGFGRRGMKCLHNLHSNHLCRRAAIETGSMFEPLKTDYNVLSHHSPPHRCGPDSRQHRRTLRSSSEGSGHSDTDALFRSRLFLGKQREYSVSSKRSKGQQAAHADCPTLSAVELIPSVDAVFLTVAHKERMQRAAAPTVLHGSRCGKKKTKTKHVTLADDLMCERAGCQSSPSFNMFHLIFWGVM